jgi:dipeptidyl aminopeptidase/acylaminoacyl peptidase
MGTRRRSLCWTLVLVSFLFALASQLNARLWCWSALSTADIGSQQSLGPIKADLIHVQQHTGVSLAWIGASGIEYVIFARGSISHRPFSLPSDSLPIRLSPDGTRVAVLRPWWPGPSSQEQHLETMRLDGSDVRKYPHLVGRDICWSPEGASAVMQAMTSKQDLNGVAPLQLVNLKLEDVRMVDPKGYVTSQCWSPDRTRFVYEASGEVWLYDLTLERGYELTRGRYPSWSPDGSAISFFDSNAYYVIDQKGQHKRLLFSKKNAVSGLEWSDDGRFVAYSSQATLREQLPVIDVETYRLRIRRLQDGAEYSIKNANLGGDGFQWIRLDTVARQDF